MYQLRGLCILTDQEKAKRKKAHKDRLAKIKNRDGSTYTKPPTVVLALVTNPRKQALKAEFNQITEQENRDMLGRISRIMTAPPKVSDEEYKKMKKLCNSLKSSKESYENDIAIKHNKKFFDRLQTVDSYYKRDKWESDYQRQKITQKFMRQVNYERPRDYQEPLRLESLYKLRNESAPTSTSSSLSHMGNVRKLRDTYSADSVSLLKKKSFYLDSYDEDGFESEMNDNDDNDKEKEGFNRPESRHMNSRSDEVNQVNSMAMASLFHKDRTDNNNNEDKNQDDTNDNYSDGGWDEFNEDPKLKDKNQVKSNNSSDKTVSQYFRDMNIPTKSSSSSNTSNQKMKIVCNKCNEDMIRINITNADSSVHNKSNIDNIDISIETKLRDHYQDTNGKDQLSEEEIISTIVHKLEIKLTKDGTYEIIINPLIATKITDATSNNDKAESGVLDNELISAVEGMFSNTHDNSDNEAEAPVRATTPLYFANEITYDESNSGDGLSSIEKISHSVVRFIKVDFVHPLITTTTTNETSQATKATTALLQRKSSIINNPLQQPMSTSTLSAPSSSSSTTPLLPRTSSMIQLTNPINQPYSEVVEATVTVNCLDDDKAHIEIKFNRNSETQHAYSETSAITANSIITTIINLPSILLADDFLKREYFANLANGASVEYTLNDQTSKPFMKLA